MNSQSMTAGTKYLRTGLILLIVLLAFVASYQIAAARDAAKQPAFQSACPRNLAGGQVVPGPGAQTPPVVPGAPGAQIVPSTPGDAGALPPGIAGGGCCGGAGAPITGAATLEGDVQRITVDTSAGYNPNIITLKAGIPAEITFKQAGGCLAQVQSEALGFFEDLTTGDKTIRLDALQPGTYEFSCGMQMVFGSIVVE